MPIYAYRCATCGHAKDVLQKISDPVLTDCPDCGAPTFVKQVTAAGFQLKGSGWYVTDFKGDKKPVTPSPGDGAKIDAVKTDPAKTDAAAASAPGTAKAADAPAPAPAPAAPPPPAAPASGAK